MTTVSSRKIFLVRKTSLAIFCLLFLCLLTSGCGKKIWPSPIDTEDAFSFSHLVGENRNGTLIITATVDGAFENVETIYLEYGENDCLKCPFVPSTSVDFTSSSPNFSLQHGALRLFVTGLDPKAVYRFRLTGSNLVRALADVKSHVATATVEKELK